MQAEMSLIPGLAMLLVGALLLWRGARGRRIDDHPLCRACGFDLFGLPPESHRCSECGVDLRNRRTIRIGHRQPVRVAMVLGMLLLFAGGAWLGTVYKPVFKQLDVNQHKPVWWLLSDAGSSTVQARDVALKELLRRLKNKSLSSSQVQRVAQKALEVQADKNKPWIPAWGDFVESAQVAGVLRSEQWQQYLKQALLGHQLEVRPKVRRGAPLPLLLTDGSVRVGRVLPIGVVVQGRQLLVSGIPCAQNRMGHDAAIGTLGVGSTSAWGVRPDDPVFAKLQDGPQTVRLSVDMRVYGGARFLGFARTTGTPAYQTQLDFEAKWELVNEPTVKGITDESLRPAIQKSVQLRMNKRLSWPPDNQDWTGVTVEFRKPPVDMAFDVLVRQGDKEWQLGSVSSKAGESGVDVTNRRLSLQDNKADVILRPNPALAESWVDITEIWNDEIIFHDFQLQTPPTTRKSRWFW